jgi:hypothetical protein
LLDLSLPSIADGPATFNAFKEFIPISTAMEQELTPIDSQPDSWLDSQLPSFLHPDMHQIDTAGSTKQRINNEPKQRIHEFTNSQIIKPTKKPPSRVAFE